MEEKETLAFSNFAKRQTSLSEISEKYVVYYFSQEKETNLVQSDLSSPLTGHSLRLNWAGSPD